MESEHPMEKGVVSPKGAAALWAGDVTHRGPGETGRGSH